MGYSFVYNSGSYDGRGISEVMKNLEETDDKQYVKKHWE